MDLRVVKTKKAIKEAFLELRKNNNLEKIKVVDICKKALINKSTFYSHYLDVFDLSNQLEDEIIEQSFNDYEYKEDLFENTKIFLEKLPETIDKNPVIDILFRDRYDVLSNKLEKMLRNYYYKKDMPEDVYIFLTFIISGGMRTMHVLGHEENIPPKKIIDVIANITEQLKTMKK